MSGAPAAPFSCPRGASLLLERLGRKKAEEKMDNFLSGKRCHQPTSSSCASSPVDDFIWRKKCFDFEARGRGKMPEDLERPDRRSQPYLASEQCAPSKKKVD